MPEIFSISGAAPDQNPCPVGWGVTPNGNCGSVGGGRAVAAVALQNALQALGTAAGDNVLRAVASDGYIGPVTVTAVNRALTSHVGPGQAAAYLRTGQLTIAQVANSAPILAAAIAAEVVRRGGKVPPTVVKASAPRVAVDVGPAEVEGPPKALWALVGLAALGVAGGLYLTYSRSA
jgi:lysozyme family protein